MTYPTDDEGFIDSEAEAEAIRDHWDEVAERERDLRDELRREAWDAADDAAEER